MADHRARKQIALLITVVAEGKENDKGGVAKDRSELKSKGTVAQVNEQEQTAGAQGQKQQEKENKAPNRKRRLGVARINRGRTAESLNASVPTFEGIDSFFPVPGKS